jgi:hypothetical protein
MTGCSSVLVGGQVFCLTTKFHPVQRLWSQLAAVQFYQAPQLQH